MLTIDVLIKELAMAGAELGTRIDDGDVKLTIDHVTELSAPVVAALKELKAELIQLTPWLKDPRTDLEDDSKMWRQILMGAWGIDGGKVDGLFGALHGLRCLGCRLEFNGTGKLRLVAGDLGDEYKILRDRYLVPHREDLVALLGLVAQL